MINAWKYRVILLKEK